MRKLTEDERDQRKKAMIEYKNAFASNNYDALRILVPKGRKEEIAKTAKQNGESINKYVNRLILRDLGYHEGDWDK